MQVNWRTMVMKFEMVGSWVTLQGDPTLCKSPISLKAMILYVEREVETYWVQFGELTVIDELLNELHGAKSFVSWI